MRRLNVAGGRDTDHPRKRGRGFAGAAVLVAGLALGFGCKNKTPEKPPERVEEVSRHPTAPPIRQTTAHVKKRTIRMTKRMTVRRRDTLFHIEREDGSALPFMRVHKIGPKGLTLRPYRLASMTFHENNLFIAAGMVNVTYIGRMFPIASIELPFGETKKFRFEDWSLTIRADKGRRRGTARITATVSGVRIR